MRNTIITIQFRVSVYYYYTHN